MTLHVSTPEGKDPLMWVWGEAVPGIAPAASVFSGAVHGASTLPLREFEAARTRVAQVDHVFGLGTACVLTANAHDV